VVKGELAIGLCGHSYTERGWNEKEGNSCSRLVEK
jgi:hypothetical protein